MSVVTSDGFLYLYDLIKFQKKGEGSIDRNCDFRSAVFITDSGVN